MGGRPKAALNPKRGGGGISPRDGRCGALVLHSHCTYTGMVLRWYSTALHWLVQELLWYWPHCYWTCTPLVLYWYCTVLGHRAGLPWYGTVLCCTGIVLVRHWDIALVLPWYHTDTAPVLPWYHTGTTLVLYCRYIGIELVLRWLVLVLVLVAGATLVLRLHCNCATFVLYWHCASTIVVL